MANNINKQDLANKLKLFTIFEDATKKELVEFIEDFTQLIKDEVVAGNSISVPGFGKFENFERQNGEKSPKFRPFEAFRDAVKEA